MFIFKIFYLKTTLYEYFQYSAFTNKLILYLKLEHSTI